MPINRDDLPRNVTEVDGYVDFHKLPRFKRLEFFDKALGRLVLFWIGLGVVLHGINFAFEYIATWKLVLLGLSVFLFLLWLSSRIVKAKDACARKTANDNNAALASHLGRMTGAKLLSSPDVPETRFVFDAFLLLWDWPSGNLTCFPGENITEVHAQEGLVWSSRLARQNPEYADCTEERYDEYSFAPTEDNARRGFIVEIRTNLPDIPLFCLIFGTEERQKAEEFVALIRSIASPRQEN